MTYATMDLIERAASRLTYAPQPFPGAVAAPARPAVQTENHPSRTPVVTKNAICTLKREGTIDWSGARTPIMEEIRLIKRRLLRRAFDSDVLETPASRLVMITSAKPGEGKTFTATNLALSISLEEDQNVLLIDADIQRQSLRRNLGIKALSGFVDLLLDPEMTLSDVVLSTDIPRLKVLPAGMVNDRAPELLGGGRMCAMIEAMMEQFPQHVIIFDSSPCLVNSDAATLASHVGQALLLVEADRTQEHEVAAALRLLTECPNVSLVLNKARPGRSTSYGGYGAY